LESPNSQCKRLLIDRVRARHDMLITIKNNNNWFIIYLGPASAASTATLSRHETPSREQNDLNRSTSLFSYRTLTIQNKHLLRPFFLHGRQHVITAPKRDTNCGLRVAAVYLFRFPFRTVFTVRSYSVVHRFAVLRWRCGGVMAVGRRWWWERNGVTSSTVITSLSHNDQNRIVIIIIYTIVAKTRNR